MAWIFRALKPVKSETIRSSQNTMDPTPIDGFAHRSPFLITTVSPIRSLQLSNFIARRNLRRTAFMIRATRIPTRRIVIAARMFGVNSLNLEKTSFIGSRISCKKSSIIRLLCLGPVIDQVFFILFEFPAEFFYLLFRLLLPHVLDLHDERCGLSKIERRQRLEQVLKRKSSFMVCKGVVIHDPCPELKREPELPVRTVCQGLDFSQIARPEDTQPYLPEPLDAFPEQGEHPVDIHLHVLKPYHILETERGNRFRSFHLFPGVPVCFHETESRSRHLGQHGAQIRAGVLGVVDLRAEKGLRNLEIVGDGLRGHPDVYAIPGDVRVPDVFGEIEFRKTARKSEVSADGLANALAVKRARQGIDNAVRDRPIVFMPMVERGNIVETVLDHRLHKELHPFRRDAPEVRVHHRACLYVQRGGDLEDGAEGAPFSRNADVRRRDLEERLDPVMEEDGLKILDRGPVYQLYRSINRAAVGIYEHRFFVREIFGNSRMDRANHVAYGTRVIIARDADEDIGGLYAFELFLHLF